MAPSAGARVVLTISFQPMVTINVHGQENIIAPGFYMPNRLSVQACRALHYLLQGRLCYLVDNEFPPEPEVLEYIRAKGIPFHYFSVQESSPRALREQVEEWLSAGQSVVFLPGMVAKVRGMLTDVPAIFLQHLGELHVNVVPLFLGYYGDSLNNLYRDVCEPGCREELYILRSVDAGMRAGEQVLSAWMEKSESLFAAQPLLQTSLTSLLVRALRKHSTVEIIDGMTGKTLPYYKVLGVAMTMARRLRKRREKRMGIILPPGPAGTIALIACMLAGITPVMINYATSRASFESTVRQAALSTFITARQFMKKLPGFSWPAAESCIFVEDMLKSLPKLCLLGNVMLAKWAPAGLICKLFRTNDHGGEDEAVMLFTAGSTGEPKGVALTHRMIIANVAQSCCRLSLDNERFLGSLPLFHSFGLTIALMLPLLKGRPICTYPNPTDARTLCELIEKYRLTLLCATPTFARAMLRRAEAYTFASVRYFIVGAERLQPEVEKAFLTRCGVQLLEGYGLTEAAPVCSVNLPDAARVQGSAFAIPGMVSRSIGCLLPGIAVRITDAEEDDKPLPLTERGMIWLKGANIFRGYVNKPELNASVFRDGWFKTGDIGQMDLNGFISLGGRLSRFSKIGGEMVPHEGVELALSQILKLSADDELKIAITGVMDAQKGEALALLSALPEHQDPANEREILSELRAALSAMELPNLWAPRYLIPVPAIPLLPTGKQDLSTCKAIAAEAVSS